MPQRSTTTVASTIWGLVWFIRKSWRLFRVGEAIRGVKSVMVRRTLAVFGCLFTGPNIKNLFFLYSVYDGVPHQ
jgi:hypothetical protein